MNYNEDEILLPPGIKVINNLNSRIIEYDQLKINTDKNKEILNTFHNVNNSKKEESLLTNNNDTSENNIDSNLNFFENINDDIKEIPKIITPYIRKRKKTDILTIISKKIVPNPQLLNEIEKNINNIGNNKLENNKYNNNSINKKELRSITQSQVRYLNSNGTFSTSKEEKIKNIINSQCKNRKSTLDIYNHKDYPSRRVKQNSFLFHRVGSGISDEKAQKSLQTHRRKMEGVQNAIIKKIKESKN
ncbi:hypothetical protein BCR32DRAFT_296965 [Anaeromyces robustus]|uniref:Uncharacterized protein n=1 Tax=Anaeromyces robustus TaxID=1754192 RepID=A0A1Y1WPL9_9FUNG|nr:hypothetical protein BCR32DRAFT_296965 [Anaeromyces robustus]|eukprot:ORX75325.1 hypothetical protein BCR32DRAFT_296965 [Anaeromyces robustus]